MLNKTHNIPVPYGTIPKYKKNNNVRMTLFFYVYNLKKLNVCLCAVGKQDELHSSSLPLFFKFHFILIFIIFINTVYKERASRIYALSK